MPVTQEDLGKQIAAAPERAGLTPAQLTQDVGLDPGDLAEIERVRGALGGKSSQPLRHPDEASTVVLARQDALVTVLDDWNARRPTRSLGVHFRGTIGIIRASVGEAVLDAKEG